jgi:ADP-L-glycero-D-manno-heptose 6-epimerase
MAKILLTGAAGFIGSYLLGYLNGKGSQDIVIVDDFEDEDKWFNTEGKNFSRKLDRSDLFIWLADENNKPDIILHLGARTDTAEFDYSVFEKLNLDYSKQIWNYCSLQGVPLIYASSAATYGAGELGYGDDHALVEHLKPLNPYGISKNEFDKWALVQQAAGKTPSEWSGLKFFNVYGPNEYHKERMASMVFHGYNQAQKTGKIKLFRSHRGDFKDGEQLRDFIYVEDIARVIAWLMEAMLSKQWVAEYNGLYNLGTGHARSFIDLVEPIFKSLGKKVEIEYIDIPGDIRDKYQYFTEAKMDKLRSIGYNENFIPVEEGVKDYVTNYLMKKKYY